MKKSTYSRCNQNCVHSEEIDGEQAVSMRPDERAPGHPAAPVRPKTCRPKPVTHGRCGDRHAEAFQFAHDPLIVPPRIFTREAQHHLANLTPNGLATHSARVRPTLRHESTLPPLQRRGRHEEGPPGDPRQESAGRREEEPVSPRHRRTTASSLEDREFVSQHDNFQILGRARPNAQSRELQDPAKHPVTE
jgi:hypothetical protein